MSDSTLVADLEARLGATLPPSYREHVLRHPPGYRRSVEGPSSDDGPPPLLSLEEIDHFATLEADWLAAFIGGYELGGPGHASGRDDPRDPATFRIDELGGTLVISAVVDDRVLLLNPARLGRDGEWEAWDFATWYPGAYRYPSFGALLHAIEPS